MYNTPQIRNGGFGALQVEAITNRPLSIARRHLAASQLRMRDIEPDELSSSEWCRFLVMEEAERDRWMTQFVRRRRNSDESSSSTELDRETAYQKAEEARAEAAEDRGEPASEASSSRGLPRMTAATPAAVMWARQFEEDEGGSSAERVSPYSQRRPMHHRRALTLQSMDAPPAYDTVVRPRARTPPPAYEPRSDDDEGGMSPRYTRYPEEIP